MAMSFISSAYSQNMSEAQIRTKINQAASQLQTLQCDFVQTKHLKMLNVTGNFAPSNFRN